MKSARRALVLGDGDGRFTARLLRENPWVQVDAIDASVAMMRELLRRAGVNAHRVRTQVADLRFWLPEPSTSGAGGSYDLVVTHFFLDCLTTGEVAELAARVRLLLAEDAVWVVSEFAVPNGRIGRWVAVPLVGCLYRAFGWMTGLKVRELPDYSSTLQRAGFQLVRQRKWLGGLLVSECWSGSGCGRPSR